MVLFLRTKQNKTIIEVEFYIKDGYLELSSSIDVETYSKVLLSKFLYFDFVEDALKDLYSESCAEFISDIAYIDEIRGWLWEVYFVERNNTKDEYEEVLKILRKEFSRIAKTHDLLFIED